MIFEGFVNQLLGINLTLNNELQTMLFLSSTQGNWETPVILVSNFAPSKKMIVDMIQDRLLNKEVRKKYSKQYSCSKAYDWEKWKMRL